MLSRNELPEVSDVIAIGIPPASELALYRALMRLGLARAFVRSVDCSDKKGRTGGAPSL